jgi:hypothetical protein
MQSTGTVQNRTDCPPYAKLRAYANSEISSDTALEQHVRECPWCLEEYRDQLQDLTWDQFLKKSTYLSFLVVIALIFGVWRSCR